jgi:hypothetical protein
MSALDVQNASDTLFGNIKKQAKTKKDILPPEVTENVISVSKTSTITLKNEVDKVTVFISSEQKDFLESVAKKVMRNRPKNQTPELRKERITSNTILRALLQNFLRCDHLLDDKLIYNEADAVKWLEKVFSEKIKEQKK